MKTFRYRIKSSDGGVRKGMIEAASEPDAKAKLSSIHGTLITLTETGSNVFKFEPDEHFTYQDYHGFLSGLIPLLRTGAQLRDSLLILSGTDKSASGRIAVDVLRGLEQGLLLSEAVSKTGKTGEMVSEFMKAGEQGAGLEHMCNLAKEYLSARLTVLKEIRSALAYPMFIVALGFIAVMIIIVFVAPALAPALTEVENAWIIRYLASVGNVIQAQYSLILLSVSGLLFSIFLLRKMLNLTGLWMSLLIRLPFIRNIYSDLAAGPAARSVGALLHAGLPLRSALRSASFAAMEPAKSGLKGMVAALERGSTLKNALSESEKYLPSEVIRILLLSDQSGDLAVGFDEAGRLCQERAILRVKRLSDLMGPMLVVGIGGLVALLMLMLLSSLTSIGDGIL